ncbi:hypothetical protein ACXGXA_24615, partial [Salmonella enterica subsp. enterica serovar Infantis]
MTETGYIQVELDGIPCASLSIPCRYTHSPAEVASLRDLADCIWLQAVKAGVTVGIGFVGMGLVIVMAIDSLSPPIKVMIERFGL